MPEEASDFKLSHTLFAQDAGRFTKHVRSDVNTIGCSLSILAINIILGSNFMGASQVGAGRGAWRNSFKAESI